VSDAVGEIETVVERDWAADRLTVETADRVLLTDDDGVCVVVWRTDLVVWTLLVTVGDAGTDLDARGVVVREFDAVDVRDMRVLRVPVGDAVMEAV